MAYGNAAEVTVETAATLHADLIVVGRRGSGLVRPALLGSTVGTVLHGARCPVLVVTNASNERANRSVSASMTGERARGRAGRDGARRQSAPVNAIVPKARYITGTYRTIT